MSEWIKTKDKLPPDLEPVLLFIKDKYSKECFVGWWDNLNKRFHHGGVMFISPCDILYDEMCFKKKDILYWRELPCMPIEELDQK